MARRSPKPPPIDDLVQRGATLVRQYAAMENSKTAVLKELARVVVDLRQHFIVEETGRVDWTGRTHGYREAVAAVYAEAGLPPDSLDTMQSALRYHVGNVLREVCPAEDLEDLGLTRKTPRERVKDSRDRLSALARAGAAQHLSGNVRADISRLIATAEVTLQTVKDEDLDDLPPERLEAIVPSLEAIAVRAQELLREIEPLRTRRRGGRRRLKAVSG